MIDGLVAGKVYRQFTERVSRNNNKFCTGKVRVAVRDGDAIFVNVIAFASTAVTALMALQDGDSCAISGELTPGVWTDKNGEARPQLDLVAHAVLTPYQVKRRRAAAGEKSTSHPESAEQAPGSGPERDPNDEIPF